MWAGGDLATPLESMVIGSGRVELVTVSRACGQCSLVGPIRFGAVWARLPVGRMRLSGRLLGGWTEEGSSAAAGVPGAIPRVAPATYFRAARSTRSQTATTNEQLPTRSGRLPRSPARRALHGGEP